MTEPDAWIDENEKYWQVISKTNKEYHVFPPRDYSGDLEEDAEPLFSGSTIQEAIDQRIEKLEDESSNKLSIHDENFRTTLDNKKKIEELKDLKEEFKQTPDEVEE